MTILNEHTIEKYPTIGRTDIWKITLYGDDKSPDYIFELSGVALEDSRPYKIVNFRERFTDVLEAQHLVEGLKLFLSISINPHVRVSEADYPSLKYNAIEFWKHERPVSFPGVKMSFQIVVDLPEEFR